MNNDIPMEIIKWRNNSDNSDLEDEEQSEEEDKIIIGKIGVLLNDWMAKSHVETSESLWQ